MPSATEQAVRRLEAALQSLETAVQRRLPQIGESAEDLTAEVEMLSADRARLAESLDRSEARTARLENVNREVSRRVANAMVTIRAVLDADGGKG